jgi:hypothetical protein
LYQVALATLRANSRLFADLRGADASTGFVNDTELDRLINLRLAEFYDLLVSARGQEYFETVTPLTATPSSATISLPNTFYQLLSLHAVWSATDREELRALTSLKDAHQFLNASWARGNSKRYRLRGAMLELFPTPTFAAALEVRFVPACPVLDDSDPGVSDVFDSINGWDRLISLGVAIDLRTINGQPASFLMNQFDRERERIAELAAQRDAGTPTRIRDESPDFSNHDRWPHGHGWPA